MNNVKKEIIDCIKKNNGAYYGKIVMHLRLPRPLILENLLELKSKGLIYKDSDGGRFKISGTG